MTFLDKYAILKKSIPVPDTTIISSDGCDYVDFVHKSKNCYFCFDLSVVEDSLYSVLANVGNKLVDCLGVDGSEKCYYCIDSNKCHDCIYLIDCNSCNDCHFSAFLNSCSDCFGCVGLSNKKYCILNNQLTHEQYDKAVIVIKKELGWKI